MTHSATPDLARARTFLFVPASRPERIAKALAAHPDVVIVDLEDAVGPAGKVTARAALLAWLDANPTARVTVRINAAGTTWHETDLIACRHPGVVGVVLPKAETAAQISHVLDTSGKPVLPIIETGAGLEELAAIAKARGCLRLVFGKLDLAVELDLVPEEADPEELVFLPYRAMLVLASQRAKLPAPLDGVFTAIDSPSALGRYAERARRHGFGGVLLIHPAQIGPVTAAFTPTAADIEWAKAVRAAAQASGGGVVVLNDRMIDAPVIARAERILTAVENPGN